VKLQGALVVKGFEPVAELGSEYLREGAHGEEVAFAGAFPAIGGEPPAGDHAVQVVMIQQVWLQV